VDEIVVKRFSAMLAESGAGFTSHESSIIPQKNKKAANAFDVADLIGPDWGGHLEYTTIPLSRIFG
jgi:hypothetical protein